MRTVSGVAFRHSSKSAELRDGAQWNTRELVPWNVRTSMDAEGMLFIHA